MIKENDDLVERLRQKPYRRAFETEDQAKVRRQTERETAADEIIRLRSDLARARKALEAARAFIDPDVSPPRKTNRELVVQINAALTEIAQN